MVTHSGTSVGAHGLRPLGLPHLADVETDDRGIPVAVLRGQRLRSVTRVQERWRVIEGWWRDGALTRTYARLVLDDGRVMTLFHDDTCPSTDGWYEQRY